MSGSWQGPADGALTDEALTDEAPAERPGDAPRCSVLASRSEEPVEGTAPHAVSWVGVVRAGPWPAKALERLPSSLTTALAAAPGVRPVLLRPVGRDDGPQAGTGLVLAGTVPGRTWLRTVGTDGTAAALAELTRPEVLAALQRGEDPGIGDASRVPAVLVCTNGARDVCCALAGRPAAALLAERLAAAAPTLLRRSPRPRAHVWESSHLGGHRFAPTAALLPSGAVLGGLGEDPAALADAVADVLAGGPAVLGYRGRSTYPPPLQAAEAAVRRHLALVGTNAGPDDVRVDGHQPYGGQGDPPAPEGAVQVLVRHTGGRTLRVVVHEEVTDELRPASCGAEPTPVRVWAAEVDADGPTGAWIVP